ncbi:DUF1254 domain-containing protein [Pseudomonas sp. GL-R-19]|uniref:DUF1254 domain-containing protein n=1 Tax=Pseudomonas sp. GL-R-19 TaxID=2832391 RepID=UPI001CBE02A7|nr:DUF1254 domain-containing protein [Pseudomonas sp. GL-R-19]
MDHGKKQFTINACVIGVALAMLAGISQAQQYPIPTTVAEVPGPTSGNTMTKDYVQMIGRMAYFWGWPLVANANRAVAFSKVPQPGLVGGVVPIAYGGIAMLTDYVTADQRVIACSNQDVVYGPGFLPLDKEPFVFQVPDFGKRFWVYALYDARTDEFSEIGQAYGTKPGFYLVVGPGWKGEAPAGITAVVRSSTALAFAIPRIFMDDTAEDRKAIQPVLSQINFYPLSKFDGKMKTTDWSKLPHYPAPKSTGPGETKWVNPETYFNELPSVMKQVPPLPGEESLYRWITSVLEAAEKDPALMQTLKETAVAADNEMLPALHQWRHNGRAAGNGWNSPVNNAQWGTDYLNRTAIATSNIYENRPEETKYLYTDNDLQGQQLNGQNSYAITFPKGQTPPVKGFWSVTLYNAEHFYQDNPLKRYSLGTKNKNLKLNADGSLTLYAGAKSPGGDKENNWLPAPVGTFSLYLRAYWPEQAILDGTWQPPKIEKMK